MKTDLAEKFIKQLKKQVKEAEWITKEKLEYVQKNYIKVLKDTKIQLQVEIEDGIRKGTSFDKHLQICLALMKKLTDKM